MSEEEEKMIQNQKMLNTYLGSKGYTIWKKDLTALEQENIKNDLIAKPFTQSAIGMGTQQVTFPVYRESSQKLYIPRYYGEKKFGLPKENKISYGESIELAFQGSLRDNQIPVIETFMKHVSSGTGGGLLELPCAFGKTCLSLYIITKLKKKTLIIVHKEFLMNQWIERIGQFLPGAKVGKIQGQTIDIEGKDIVLGMLQSLSMKEYPDSIFESFGFTIIDEVHHISSEVFSCALFKIVTNYTLGLSATMNRKDGTTKIFKMFLGEVVYKGKRDEEHQVVVRAIEYKGLDEEFNEVKTDYRGNVQYSTMISKLCCYNHRTEFILRILKDLFEENGNQQVMILAHNRNLLEYLYDAILLRKIAGGSVGYYVGGMKEAALKETEGKKIVVATFSMAQEALDIKTLTTLIMATPKTDIEQAVGRILREKHGSPIVVDIIDSHEPFRNQWSKRKQFYKKQNYKIIQTSHARYNPDVTQWTTVFEPGSKICKEEKDSEFLQGKCLIPIYKKKS